MHCQQIISPMATIRIINRTKRISGNINIRFRLADGRDVDLYHKSEIIADISDLNKFGSNGEPKKRANFNRTLKESISDRISLIESVYDGMVKRGIELNNVNFESEIDKILHPFKYQEDVAETQQNLLDRLDSYIDALELSKTRTAEYRVVRCNLFRFITIKKKGDVLLSDVNADFITDFQAFLKNEWKYVKKYPRLYSDIKKQNLPVENPKQNTLMSKMKMLKCFFAALEERDEVVVNPFRKLGRSTRGKMLREEALTPIALTRTEVKKILCHDVPPRLKDTKDALLLQIYLGCRISDFKQMDMTFIKVSGNGIPYVVYSSQKTGLLTETPLVRTAFDIVMKTDFNLPILKNISGKGGYNKRIHELLETCGINREVEVGKNGSKVLFAQLHEVASNKIARKTNVTLCADAQIDKALMGLHEKGSKAISAYDVESIDRKFGIACIAFGEKPYRVNQNLEIMEELV